jgi:hypothetical protein
VVQDSSVIAPTVTNYCTLPTKDGTVRSVQYHTEVTVSHRSNSIILSYDTVKLRLGSIEKAVYISTATNHWRQRPASGLQHALDQGVDLRVSVACLAALSEVCELAL